MIVPGEGVNAPPAGFSALMRTSMACPFAADVVLTETEWLAGRHPELPLDEVETGHQLGHRVLHLQARVHLEEVELAVLIEELDGARVDVAAGLGDAHRGLAHRPPDVVGEVGRGALLDELLVTPLGGAVPLAEPERVAMGVRDDLHLDVARPGEVALDVALVAAEVRSGLATGGLERVGRVPGGCDDFHAPPATSVGGLDGDRPAEFLAEGDHLFGRGEHLGAPGHPRDAGALGGVPRADLVAHDLDRLGRRTDEGHAPLGDRAGEVGVLRKEPVARMDRVGPARLDDVEDGLGVQVALRGGLASEGVRLVRQADVEGVPVELGVDRHRRDAELPAGSDDPDRDFAPVRDEHLLQHAAPFGSTERDRAGAEPTAVPHCHGP